MNKDDVETAITYMAELNMEMNLSKNDLRKNKVRHIVHVLSEAKGKF